MGKKSGKPVKEKNTHDFKNILVSFSPFRNADETPGTIWAGATR
jgi:hypothetical protein